MFYEAKSRPAESAGLWIGSAYATCVVGLFLYTHHGRWGWALSGLALGIILSVVIRASLRLPNPWSGLLRYLKTVALWGTVLAVGFVLYEIGPRIP
jgi:hypothetical protein